MKNIAVWNTAYLGDTVLTLPLIQTLKNAYPEANIDFYVRKGFANLYTHNPLIHNVVEYQKRKKTIIPTLQLIHSIRQQNYDLWINVHPSIRSSFITGLSKAKIRIGYTENFLQFLCCTHLVKRKWGTLDEIERILDLISCLNIDPSCIENWPEIFIPKHVEEKINTFWNTSITGPALGINPGSAWETKCWLPEGFAAIAKKAIEHGAHVILLGSINETHLAEKIIQHAQLEGHPAVHNLSGHLDLIHLAALIKKLTCCLVNDSGPMHMAWTLKTPVTAIFGPTVPCLGFAPRGTNSSIISVELNCRPCGRHGGKTCPKKHFRCMKDIDPNTVWGDVSQKLLPHTL